MKKFNFRLQTILKLKEFHEDKKKIELGQINKQRADIKHSIEQCYENIRIAKKEENDILANPISADFLPFYPRYIRGQKNKISQLKQELRDLDQEYEEKLKELNLARGEVKTFEKLKEKEFEKYNRDLKRAEMLQMEEMVNIKRQREKEL